MKALRKVLISLLAALFVLSGCSGGKTAKINTYLINGYEGYYDLVYTSMFGEIFGEVAICQEKEYITQGSACARLLIDNNSEFGSPQQDGDTLRYASFKYDTIHYHERFKQISNIKNFRIDIYNDTPCELEVYFAAMGTEKTNYFTQGAVLAANSWNYLTFEVKPHFFDENTFVKEYVFYLDGLDALPNKKGVLYIDNFRAEVYESAPSAPSAPKDKELNFNGIEILNFDDAGDYDFILTKNNPPTEYLYPMFYAQSSKEYDGSLRVELNVSNHKNDVWAEGNGYDILVSKAVLEKVKKPKTISVTCVNPSGVSRYVSLIISSDASQMTVKVHIPAGETVTVEAKDLNFEHITDLTIRIDSWNITQKSRLYFKNLQYTV
ncbi:MAG TPA: hypothetical protein VIL24_01040 [Clostridia bacterium]